MQQATQRSTSGRNVDVTRENARQRAGAAGMAHRAFDHRKVRAPAQHARTVGDVERDMADAVETHTRERILHIVNAQRAKASR